jgi:hypothetical protein
MGQGKVSFTFHNQRDRDVELLIEPWALVENVKAGALVVFEVNATPAADVEFSVTDEGDPFIYVVSEHVTICIGGVTKHDFTTAIRPTLSAFRVLNKGLWSESE